jgi:hypothetical protein
VTTTYYVSINDGYNMVNGDVAVEVLPLPVPEAGVNDTVWNGTNGYLAGSGLEGSGDYTYTWEPSDKLLNPFSPTPTTVKLYETTLFRLTISDNVTGCVCAGEDLVTVVVLGGPLAVTADITDPVICRGTTTQLHALPSGGNPDYSFSWSSDPAGFSSAEMEPMVSPVLNTTYTVVVYDQFNTYSASVNVEVSQPPMVNLGTDILACPYDTVRFNVNLPGMTYYWSNGSDQPGITIGTTGIGFDIKKVWVRVENELGCTGSDTVQVVFDFAQCSGIDEPGDGAKVYIYPNPTTGKIQVEWTGLSGNVELQISDLDGKKIMSKNIQAAGSGEYKGSFDLSSQPKGVYLMKLVGSEKVLIRKIILQ